MAKFSVEGTVRGADIFQKLLLLVKSFLCAGADQHNGGNSSNNIQITDHVGSGAFIHAAAAGVGIYHQFIYTELLVDSADHNCLVYGLVITTDKVTVEIGVQIVHVLYIRQRIKGKNIIYVESMLRQGQVALKEQLGAVDHGVHEKIFSLWHMTNLIPGEDLIHWQAVTVLHNLLAGSALFLVYKVTDEKVNCFGALYQLFQSFQDLFVGFFIYPVITVYNLEIEALGIVDASVYGAAVAKVWLMNGADNAWIFLLVFICDLGCPVLGSIVNYKDLYFVSSW